MREQLEACATRVGHDRWLNALACGAVLCCAVLCCAVLCCAVLCCLQTCLLLLQGCCCCLLHGAVYLCFNFGTYAQCDLLSPQGSLMCFALGIESLAMQHSTTYENVSSSVQEHIGNLKK